MNVLRSGIVTMLLLAAFSVQAACTWPAWEQFKKDVDGQIQVVAEEVKAAEG